MTPPQGLGGDGRRKPRRMGGVLHLSEWARPGSLGGVGPYVGFGCGLSVGGLGSLGGVGSVRQVWAWAVR